LNEFDFRTVDITKIRPALNFDALSITGAIEKFAMASGEGRGWEGRDDQGCQNAHGFSFQSWLRGVPVGARVKGA
ncbi:MAG: hypothetical protein AAF825_12900, partial [Pseudomonadota bacterium]